MTQSQTTQTGRDSARAICDYSDAIHAADLRDPAQFVFWRAFALENAIAARANRIAPADWQTHLFIVWRAQRIARNRGN